MIVRLQRLIERRSIKAFAGQVQMAADALSDVLKTVRLTGATFFDVVTRAPWVAEQPTPEMVLPRILAAEQLTRQEIAAMGHGGLCLHCPECRYPVCPFGKGA